MICSSVSLCGPNKDGVPETYMVGARTLGTRGRGSEVGPETSLQWGSWSRGISSEGTSVVEFVEEISERERKEFNRHKRKYPE